MWDDIAVLIFAAYLYKSVLACRYETYKHNFLSVCEWDSAFNLDTHVCGLHVVLVYMDYDNIVLKS